MLNLLQTNQYLMLMKKILLMLLLGIAVVSFPSCKNEKDEAMKQLQSELAGINAELPNQVDEYTTWTSVEIADGNLVYNYTIADTEDGAVIKALRDNASEHRAMIRESFLESTDLMNSVKPLLVKAGLGIKYLYTSQTTGDTMEVVFTPEEVADL